MSSINLQVARIMKHLAANGVVRETGQDQYCATPFTMSTHDPAINSGLIYGFECMISAFHGLPEFLAKTNYEIPRNGDDGPFQYGVKTDKSLFAFFQANPRLGTAFNNFMAGYTKSRPSWVDFYPCQERLIEGSLEKGPLVVDVGGGLGQDIVSFYKKHGDAPGDLVLEDTPAVVGQSQLPSAIKTVGHDFFQPQPAEYQGARAYYLRLILHDWPDDKCQVILSHIRDAMKPGYSKLLINENALAEVGAPWQQTSLDWTMMAVLVSAERTEGQWADLLGKAGLKISGIWRKDPTSESVIEAVLADDLA